MLGECSRETPCVGVLLPARITGFKRQMRIDPDRSCHLRASTAEVWQKLAAQCEKQALPLHAFEDAVRERHPDAVIRKADNHWCVLPFGEWTGMPKIYVELHELPLYETHADSGTFFS